MICTNCQHEIPEEWGEHVVFVSIIRAGVVTPMILADVPPLRVEWGKRCKLIPVIGVMEFEDAQTA